MDSWMAMAGHMGVWKEDTYRYKGALGHASVNLKYYGVPDSPVFNRDYADFNSEGTFLYQELKRRMGGTDIFVGLNYMYFNCRKSNI